MATYDQLNSTRNSPYGHQAQSPYGSGDPYYNASSGYVAPQPAKKGVSKWIKFGVPLLILAIVGGVVGGVLGSRKSNTPTSASAAAAASSAASAQNAIGVFPTATNSLYMVPIYPSTVSLMVYMTLSLATFLTDVVRPTLRFSQHPRLIRVTMPLLHGLQIPSNPPIRVLRAYDKIAPALSPLLTNGPHYPISSPVTLTSSLGTTLFFKMLRNIATYLLSYTSWMAIAVSWITHARSNKESRHLLMHIACPTIPNGLIGRSWSFR
jgi:hypothetical protein